MHVGTDHNPPSLATLVAGLGDLGWFDGSPAQVMQQLIGDGKLVDGRMKQLQGEYDGQRIQLIWRNLDGKDQAGQQAKEFVRERVDLIVAFEDKSIRAAQDATADPANRIPVVFLHPSDPVRDGLVDSLSHPGGNLTGVLGARDPVAKQLEIYRQILPGPQPLRLLTLVDPTDNRRRRRSWPRRAMPPAKLGIELDEREAADDAGLEAAFQSLPAGRGRRRVHPVAQPPAQLLEEDPRAGRGGEPAGPGPPPGMGRPAAERPGRAVLARRRRRARRDRRGPFVDSILKGAKPADLPAQEVPKVEFALSLKRAAELGITVPDDVIAQADLVYPIADAEAGTHGGNAGTAASAPRLEVRGGRRDARRGGHRLGRGQRVLVLLRGQQAGRDRGRGGQGVVRRHLDPPVHRGARRRPRRRGPADPGRHGRNGARAVVQEPVPAPAGDQRADVPRCGRRGVRARLLQRGRPDRQPDLRGRPLRQRGVPAREGRATVLRQRRDRASPMAGRT